MILRGTDGTVLTGYQPHRHNRFFSGPRAFMRFSGATVTRRCIATRNHRLCRPSFYGQSQMGSSSLVILNLNKGDEYAVDLHND